jgi:anti-sigma factor RsiW
MNCDDVRQHWMLYFDSEGDAELHLRISDHIAICPACAEWFTRQQRFEAAVTERLAAGKASPELWQRTLARAGITSRTPARQRRSFLGSMLAVAAAVLFGVGIWIWIANLSHSSELALLAADWHGQVLQGEVQPSVVSSSDKEVEDQLRKLVKFPVHCPPRKDANFDLKGAGVCQVMDRQAAYIVGEVNRSRVSILVLDKASLDAFPRERARIVEAGGRHRCREGKYQMISGVTRDNLLIVIGNASAEELERLFAAYGSYHEG